jgi:hypothetical protein
MVCVGDLLTRSACLHDFDDDDEMMMMMMMMR